MTNTITLYTLLWAPLITLPNFRLEWAKSIPVFQPKWLKNQSFGHGRHIHGSYKRESSPWGSEVQHWFNIGRVAWLLLSLMFHGTAWYGSAKGFTSSFSLMVFPSSISHRGSQITNCVLWLSLVSCETLLYTL